VSLLSVIIDVYDTVIKKLNDSLINIHKPYFMFTPLQEKCYWLRKPQTWSVLLKACMTEVTLGMFWRLESLQKKKM